MATLKKECPDEILVSLKETKDGFVQELRIAVAVRIYELGKLSSVKAIRLAGMDKATSLKTLRESRISISTMEEFTKDYED